MLRVPMNRLIETDFGRWVMFRALFFACGTFTALCGGLLLFVDRVELTDYAAERLTKKYGPVAAVESPASANSLKVVYAVHRKTTAGADCQREVIDPPDWSAFCLLSVGSVTILYALALPGRKGEENEDDED
jgi:hypothetical protein